MRTLMAMTVLAIGTAVAAEPAKSNPLAGYWKPQSVEFDGQQQIDPKSGAPLTLVVKDNEYRMYYCTDTKSDTHFRLFTADLTFDPAAKTFELSVKDGQKKGERRHGIFELSGNTLKVCYGPVEQPRPTSFSAPKGSGFFNETWMAEKK